MGMGSLNQPVLGQMGQFGFGYQYMTQIGTQEKKNKILVKIGRLVAVFPFLRFLTSLPLQLCFNCVYV